MSERAGESNVTIRACTPRALSPGFRRSTAVTGGRVPPRGMDTKDPPDQAICRGDLVARAGIEPATFRFSGGRSYQLSYLAAGTRGECHTRNAGLLRRLLCDP